MWSVARKIIEEVFEDDDQAPLDRVEGLMHQFASLDPFATGFRYPEDKKGGPLLPEIRHINVAQLSEAMEEVHELLEGVMEGICHYLECKQDMEAEGYYY